MKSIEKWRTIPEFPDYVVSNEGRFAKKTGKILSTYQASYRKPQIKVCLYKVMPDGSRKEFRRGVKSLIESIWPSPKYEK